MKYYTLLTSNARANIACRARSPTHVPCCNRVTYPGGGGSQRLLARMATAEHCHNEIPTRNQPSSGTNTSHGFLRSTTVVAM